MKSIRIFFIIMPLLWLVTSCSSGSNSGGGSSNAGGTTTSGTVPLTYTKADLKGTWRWVANLQSGSATLTGTMTFDGEVRLIGYETDRCPGRQILNAEFWMWEDGFVKGRNYAFCTDTTALIKFGIYFQGTNKKIISGIADLHYLVNGEETYDRFDITLTKQ